MRVTAICNLKGGVAKTTTAINLAAILAEGGSKVLLVDADSQCNLTEFMTGEAFGLGTLADGLRGGVDRMFPVNTRVKGVKIVPADESLMDLDLSIAASGKLDVSCLSGLKRKLSADYDYIIIDCPPAFNAAAAAALLAADDVLIPIKLDAFSLRGMANLKRQILNMRSLNPLLSLAGVLPTMSYKSENVQSSIKTLQEYGLTVFSPIRRTPKVDDMTFDQKPIIYSSPKSAAAKDYRLFAEQYKGGASV